MALEVRDLDLTIITITRNDSVGLHRTLLSTERFRSRSWVQHIVIDGSDAADNQERMPDSVEYFKRSPAGVADAFNAGLAIAHGEWVWFLNGGDQMDKRLDPDFVVVLLRNSAASVLIGGLIEEGALGVNAHANTNMQWPPLVPWIPHPSTLVRRRLFGYVGTFDPRYLIAMDYEWWLRVLAGAVAVDLLSMPFVVFAPGGLSRQEKMRARLAMERDDAIRRHQPKLWRSWIAYGYRLARSTWTALLSERLSKAPPSV